jgi:hypothetical protein
MQGGSTKTRPRWEQIPAPTLFHRRVQEEASIKGDFACNYSRTRRKSFWIMKHQSAMETITMQIYIVLKKKC